LFPDIEIKLSKPEQEQLADMILSSNITNSLLKKLGGKDIKNFTKKIGIENIKKALSIFKTVVGEQMASGVCVFTLAMIEKTFSDSMKITKNDIIDSQLLFFYPKLQLFTLDIRLKKIIKEFDEKYYSFIVDLEDRCRY
jgi:hypothetical protein